MPFHVRSRYGKRHHHALRRVQKPFHERNMRTADSTAINRVTFTRRSPCSISAGFALYSALDVASLPASASAEEVVSSEEAFSGSAAALSADPDWVAIL